MVFNARLLRRPSCTTEKRCCDTCRRSCSGRHDRKAPESLSTIAILLAASGALNMRPQVFACIQRRNKQVECHVKTQDVVCIRGLGQVMDDCLDEDQGV